MTSPTLIPVRDLAACCSPMAGEPIGAESAAQFAAVLKALADPARLRILSMVAAHVDGEACVCDLTAPLGLQQSTVSHHLRILVDAGFLSRSQRGTWAYYRLIPRSLGAVTALLGTLDPGPDER
ncbi:metalloregulator ArsR/SmtB family transcription factor [Microbacterium sp.]|uniref:metalloregulator ArsR/SmtB family transcription factor n=1 Tax=Microbacterium sp. TaxID=51671 RepID=UPI0039E5E9A1